ncbi:hypothetical protein KR009_007322 [Drosophila setifemur]|nr:hypothetical protein KR009_007322 [Drosophila setifemur]
MSKKKNVNSQTLSAHLKGGKLENDTKLHGIVQNFVANIAVLEADMKKALSLQKTQKLDINDQIKLDTYLAYVSSTLYWMNLKLQGIDASKHSVVHDLGRAKELLARDKQINESLAAPRLDMPATKRFISAGLHKRFVDMDGVMVTEDQYNKSLVETRNRAKNA